MLPIKNILVLLCFSLLRFSRCIDIANFYPFGISNGDTRMPTLDDDAFSVPLPTPIKYFGISYTQLFISSNGIVTFGISNSGFTSSRFPLLGDQYNMLAIYWNDIDTRKGGDIFYRIVTSDSVLLNQISADVQQAYANQFQANLVFIGTYANVGAFSSSYANLYLTFQVTLASDGNNAYAIYFYNRLDWGDNPQAGFNAGDGVKYLEIVGSGTPNLKNAIGLSNVNRPGVWIFSVAGANIECPAATPFYNLGTTSCAQLQKINNPCTDGSQCPNHYDSTGNMFQSNGTCDATKKTCVCNAGYVPLNGNIKCGMDISTPMGQLSQSMAGLADTMTKLSNGQKVDLSSVISQVAKEPLMSLLSQLSTANSTELAAAAAQLLPSLNTISNKLNGFDATNADPVERNVAPLLSNLVHELQDGNNNALSTMAQQLKDPLSQLSNAVNDATSPNSVAAPGVEGQLHDAINTLSNALKDLQNGNGSTVSESDVLGRLASSLSSLDASIKEALIENGNGPLNQALINVNSAINNMNAGSSDNANFPQKCNGGSQCPSHFTSNGTTVLHGGFCNGTGKCDCFSDYVGTSNNEKCDKNRSRNYRGLRIGWSPYQKVLLAKYREVCIEDKQCPSHYDATGTRFQSKGVCDAVRRSCVCKAGFVPLNGNTKCGIDNSTSLGQLGQTMAGLAEAMKTLNNGQNVNVSSVLSQITKERVSSLLNKLSSADNSTLASAAAQLLPSLNTISDILNGIDLTNADSVARNVAPLLNSLVHALQDGNNNVLSIIAQKLNDPLSQYSNAVSNALSPNSAVAPGAEGKLHDAVNMFNNAINNLKNKNGTTSSKDDVLGLLAPSLLSLDASINEALTNKGNGALSQALANINSVLNDLNGNNQSTPVGQLGQSLVGLADAMTKLSKGEQVNLSPVLSDIGHVPLLSLALSWHPQWHSYFRRSKRSRTYSMARM